MYRILDLYITQSISSAFMSMVSNSHERIIAPLGSEKYNSMIGTEPMNHTTEMIQMR